MPLPGPDLTALVRSWILDRHLAQLFTLDPDGYPAGRTVGVLLNEDWTVDCLAERTRHRALQAAANPRVAIMWDDGGQPVPRVLFIRGDAEIQDGPAMLEAHHRRMQNFVRRGEPRSPRSAEELLRYMVNIRIHPRVIRIEGFGSGTQAFEFRPGPGESAVS